MIPDDDLSSRPYTDGAGTAGELTHGPGSRVVYVALGASDTVGVGAARPESDNWTAVLARRLSAAAYVNLGRSGITLGAALAQELPAALAARPTLVTAWFGVNDLNAFVMPPAFGAHLDQLLGALAGADARVFIGNVPDLRLVPVYRALDPSFVDAAVRAYNGVIAGAARRHGAVVVDLYGGSHRLWGHPELLSYDGFHPSTRGYLVLADAFEESIRRHRPEGVE